MVHVIILVSFPFVGSLHPHHPHHREGAGYGMSVLVFRQFALSRSPLSPVQSSHSSALADLVCLLLEKVTSVETVCHYERSMSEGGLVWQLKPLFWFFSLHYFPPCVLIALAIVHLVALHAPVHVRHRCTAQAISMNAEQV